MKEKNWNFQKPWNDALAANKFTEYKRDYLYASEIGGSMYDVYQSMIGTPATNPANDRALRTMEAGKFHEEIVGWVLQRCGILQTSQERVKGTLKEGLLEISGKMDFVAGCDGNWQERLMEVKNFFETMRKNKTEMLFMDRVEKISLEVLRDFGIRYPHGLEDKILEVKSLNSRGFWKENEPISKPYEHHKYQLTWYLYKNLKAIRDGAFCYIDRDTNTISIVPWQLQESVLAEMTEWVTKMTEYYRKGECPPKPEFIVQDEEGKYQFNWRVDWSNYKDLILKDVDMEKIRAEIDLKNLIQKESKLINAAFKQETVYGVKKYLDLLDMLRKGKTDTEIIKKHSVLQETIEEAKKLMQSLKYKTVQLSEFAIKRLLESDPVNFIDEDKKALEYAFQILKDEKTLEENSIKQITLKQS